MYNCNHPDYNCHTNAFIDLQGVPYLLGEYMDTVHYQPLDRSLVRDEVYVDQSDSMRAVVDISVNNIKRTSGGELDIHSNINKYFELMAMISNNYSTLNGKFNVIRKGITIRVDYQLEDRMTGRVIRTMNETFRIKDRNYFIDVKNANIGDNGIVTNFTNTLVSTITEFTHGQNPMQMRITNIYLDYEIADEPSVLPSVKTNMATSYQYDQNPSTYGVNNDITYYPNSYPNHYPHHNNPVNNPTSRMYSFYNAGNDIVLNMHEIYDPMTAIATVPIRTININRIFTINPGHRIIFKFSIWDNDVTVVDDTTEIANKMNALINNDHCVCPPICPPHPYPPYPPCPPSYPPKPCPSHHTIDELYGMILQLNNSVESINNSVNGLQELTTQQGDKLKTMSEQIIRLHRRVLKLENAEPGGDSSEIHENLQNQITGLDNDLDQLQDHVETIPDVLPIDSQSIQDIVNESSSATAPASTIIPPDTTRTTSTITRDKPKVIKRIKK